MLRTGTNVHKAEPLSTAEAEELRVRTQQIFLAVGMLVAGTANTLTCKAALSSVSLGSEFNHPFVMASCMFAGEILCLVAYQVGTLGRRRTRVDKDAVRVPKHVFALPAMCDIAGTSVMYLGLTLTSASTYQMLRGSVIIFTGALSAVYLKRRQWGFHWCAMLLVFAGVLTVGYASQEQAVPPPDPMQHSAPDALLVVAGDVLQLHSAGSGRPAPDAPEIPTPAAAAALAAATAAAEEAPLVSRAMVGNLLVVGSQVFTALQMCLEEKFVTGYNMPALLAVGWEGVWGLAGVATLLVALQHTATTSGAPIEDTIFSVRQLLAHPTIGLFMVCNALSIAWFNYFGMSVTKTSSAAYRMVLDSLRTLVVWLVDLGTGGGSFHWLSLVGFALMAAGTAVYNEAIQLPCLAYPSAADRAEQAEQRAVAQEHAKLLLPANASEPTPSPLLPQGSGRPAPPPVVAVKDIFTPKLTRLTLQKN